MRRGRLVGAVLVGVVLALCLAAGCAVSGTPVAVSDPAPSGAPSTRPREIRLDGIDPCTLLTEEQKKQLGLTERSVLSVTNERVYKGVTRLCSTRGERPRSIAVGVTLVMTAGMEIFTPDAVRGTLAPLRTHGFPGLQLVSPEYPEACTVIVDVAAGQLLDVQFRDGGGRATVPQPELCAGARQATDLVMTSLLSR
ncbi:MAG: DUF3558 domain-containing protein [Pseudonocardia sp.]|nr:DUF3558 domain-containing protein [Pseudonocardia sp.]